MPLPSPYHPRSDDPSNPLVLAILEWPIMLAQHESRHFCAGAAYFCGLRLADSPRPHAVSPLALDSSPLRTSHYRGHSAWLLPCSSSLEGRSNLMYKFIKSPNDV